MSTKVSESVTYDAKTGQGVTTLTFESLQSYPSIPSQAIDATKSYEGGVYRVTYKLQGDSTDSSSSPIGSTGNYTYEIRSSLSTEPLKTHPYFRSGGKWDLSSFSAELAEMERDPGKIAEYADRSDSLGEYAGRVNDGMTSYLAPGITMHVSSDENSLPDLSQLGKIATVSNAPSVPSGATWMLTGCQSSALQNGKWRNSYEYRLSGVGGWDTGIYGI